MAHLSLQDRETVADRLLQRYGPIIPDAALDGLNDSLRDLY